MNSTRIQVPLGLSEPHFDDESTVAQARPVVPISRARTLERWRKTLILVPIVLVAAVCGALVAIALTQYERIHRASSEAAEKAPVTNFQNSPSPAPAIPMAAAGGTTTEAGLNKAGSVESGEANTSQKTETPSAPETEVIKVKEDNGNAKKQSPSSSPKELTRPRRVHPANDQDSATQNPQKSSKARGAGRIQDIFGGPNP